MPKGADILCGNGYRELGHCWLSIFTSRGILFQYLIFDSGIHVAHQGTQMIILDIYSSIMKEFILTIKILRGH